MPAIQGLECGGYPIYRGRCTYKGTPDDLSKVVRQIGAKVTTDIFDTYGDQIPASKLTTDQFVNAQAIVITNGFEVDATGRQKRIDHELLLTIKPQHAHGGGYSYGPVAKRYADQFSSKIPIALQETK